MTRVKLASLAVAIASIVGGGVAVGPSSALAESPAHSLLATGVSTGSRAPVSGQVANAGDPFPCGRPSGRLFGDKTKYCRSRYGFGDEYECSRHWYSIFWYCKLYR